MTLKQIMQLIYEEYSFASLDQEKQDKLYDLFKDSYDKSTKELTGESTSWSKGKFEGRARSWVFYGNPPEHENAGGIAIRKQRSGLLKLNASFGSLKGIIAGFDELIKKEPDGKVWGAMPENLANMVIKLGTKRGGDFVKLPTDVLKAVGSIFASSMGISTDDLLDSSGNINYKMDNGKVMKKEVVVSKNTLRWFLHPATKAYWKKEKNMELPVEIENSIKELIGEGIIKDTANLVKDTADMAKQILGDEKVQAKVKEEVNKTINKKKDEAEKIAKEAGKIGSETFEKGKKAFGQEASYLQKKGGKILSHLKDDAKYINDKIPTGVKQQAEKVAKEAIATAKKVAEDKNVKSAIEKGKQIGSKAIDKTGKFIKYTAKDIEDFSKSDTVKKAKDKGKEAIDKTGKLLKSTAKDIEELWKKRRNK